MRSGFKLACYNESTSELTFCEPADAVHDSYIVLAQNQMDICLGRPLASDSSTNTTSQFVYANCDTMVLGEILHRATGKDLQDYAEINLFSKIDLNAQWWRDNSDAQVGGNRLAYCCLDATPRDFAKFGQLILNNGLWDNEQIVPTEYIQEIKNIEYYGLQFWAFTPTDQAESSIYAALGVDDQLIIIDFDNQMVVVRNSLYQGLPIIGNQRKMSLEIYSGLHLADVDFFSVSAPLTLPMSVLQSATGSSFSKHVFYKKIAESLQ